MVAVNWYYNRCVTLLSNCIGANPVTSVKIWDSKKKRHVVLDYPAIIPAYKRSMGGVDFLNKICSYRCSVKTQVDVFILPYAEYSCC